MSQTQTQSFPDSSISNAPYGNLLPKELIGNAKQLHHVVGLNLQMTPPTQMSWIVSIILLSVFSILSAFTFQLLTSAGIIYNSTTGTLTSSYSNLCAVTVLKLQIFADMTIFLNCLGSLCAYLVIIGDLMPDAMALFITDHTSYWLNRRLWITLYLLCLIIPFSLFQRLDFLKFTSLFAMLCFVFITISMTIFFYDGDAVASGLKPWVEVKDLSQMFRFFKATAVYSFAFGTHALAFSITNELWRSTNKRMNMVIAISFCITSLYYIAIGVLGYCTFGNAVQSNILNNYPQRSILLCCVRIGLSFALAFSYPILLTPGRQSLSGIVYKCNVEQLTCTKYYMLTFGIIITSYIVAMTVTDLGTVFGFIGSTSSPTIIFILPGIFYHYINKKMHKETQSSCDRLNQYGSILSVLFGVFLVVVSLFVFFRDNH
eukprot:480293_1